MLYFGLLASFVLEYVRPGGFLPVISALKLNTLVPLLVFFAALYAAQRHKNNDIFGHRNSRWLGFFLCLMAISIVHVDVTFNSFQKFTMVLGYVLLGFAVAKLVDSNERLKWLALTLVFNHVVLVALNPDVVLHPEKRSYLDGVTFLGDGNDFALSVVVVIPLCLYLFLDAPKKINKLLALGMLVLLMLAVIGTQSRGASIAVAVVLLYLWWRGRSKVVGLLGMACVAMVVFFYAPENYFGRMETISNYEQEGSAMGRIMAWKSAVRMANDHPFIGVGTGHFPIKFGIEYRPPEYAGQNLPWLTAHSIYFLALGELGYLGVIFLLGILYSNYRSAERIIRRVRTVSSPLARRYERMFLCLNSSLIGYAVGGAFLSALYYLHLYVISAIFIAAELMYRRDEAFIFAESETTDANGVPALGRPA